ncbi:hypothetical protein OG413_46815 [Streptomyces sp. NBC_01433]|uniref:hypothetical protein n=1 Tax=Streptomyces sp. NBC_01433 TaxID=2903864 RepID=UPI002254F2F1|nr:hypothetical protein [Streptomyces sp. NBC_01433]MCX4682661.1 hypothetical protein [Streptomyces sp. NBC_01433]MCX4682701.1 hypothetical protein [Streptomyces sp. NBC_01433]
MDLVMALMKPWGKVIVVDAETNRPVLTLDADFPSGRYMRLDDGRHVPDHSTG